jgi:hypothetical protein
MGHVAAARGEAKRPVYSSVHTTDEYTGIYLSVPRH